MFQYNLFTANRLPIYKPPTDDWHKWYDPTACNCKLCLQWSDEKENQLKRRKKKLSQQKLKKRYKDGNPMAGLLGEHNGNFDYYVTYNTLKNDPPLSCMVDQEEEDYDDIFPPFQYTSKKQQIK